MGFVPDQTQVTAASEDAVDFLAALYNYINNGNSTSFEIDTSVSNQTGDGFVFRPTDSGEAYQISMRMQSTGNDDPIECLVESDESLTAAGGPGTPPSGITNGEENPTLQYGWYGGTFNTSFWIIESNDLLQLIHPDDSGSETPAVFQIGRVVDSMPFTGFSGLGYFGTAPGKGLIGTTVPWSNTSYVELLPGTWGVHTGGTLVRYDTDLYDEDGLGIPIPITAEAVFDVPSGNDGLVGKPRYIFKNPDNDDTTNIGNIIEDPNDTTAFAVVGISGDPQGYIVPWDRSFSTNF